jgi:hypothetical protein
MGQKFPTGRGTSRRTYGSSSRAGVNERCHSNTSRPAIWHAQVGADAPKDLSILAQSLDTRTDPVN